MMFVRFRAASDDNKINNKIINYLLQKFQLQPET
jgi:hypothetical protein